ncbi:MULTISPECIES: topoisomerase II [Atlantibacter]|uniref:topoisomerase II n=1 Tax=Atlantibacter TaxID=1903434 RepID=UPI000EEB6B35|nr:MULTISPECIES: topoisomerase II [Atlantibacter]MBW9429699.1 topoisomerase II [Atlantibacter hermannii]MCQ4968572.1 topoisomerase II [Enterobacteriaceae bacterium DFI.7.85]MDU1952980.1 topoisomerase II [Atlantibacter hermannii]HAP81998.1 topoisomerase II [Enterobacteriaceae bacterium]
MNWTHVILAGYVGAVIAIVVGVFRKKGWIGKTSAVVIALLAIAVWNIIDVKYLIPRDNAASQMTEAEKFDQAMEKLPLYQVIREQEPETWRRVREQALSMQKAGESEQNIIDAIQPQILNIQMSRLQTAPDANVVAFMQANMEQTAQIQKQSDDACFRFLFPGVKGGINAAKLLPAEVTQHRLEVDAEMMRAAFGPNKHQVTPQERQQAVQDVQPVVQKLMKQYGQDIALMNDPRKAIGKEGVVCNITQDLWRDVLQMPTNKAAGIIRYSVSAEQ